MADAVTAARARIDRALADLETKIAGLKAKAGVDRDDDLFAPRGADSARVAELEAAGAQAAEALLANHPKLTVERHLRNFHWKNPADIAHYRDGLLKAGLPFGKLALVASASKFAVDS